jgi:hypothetical protein
MDHFIAVSVMNQALSSSGEISLLIALGGLVLSLFIKEGTATASRRSR